MFRPHGRSLVRVRASGLFVSTPAAPDAEERGLTRHDFHGDDLSELPDVFDDVAGGESVTAKRALSIAAVWQAVSMISGDVAQTAAASLSPARTEGPRA